MIAGFGEFKELVEKEEIKMFNNSLKPFLKKFTYLEIIDEINFNSEVQKNIIQSKIIVIDTYSNDNFKCFIVCIDRYLIIIDQFLRKNLETVLAKVDNSKNNIITNLRGNSQLIEEISNFVISFQIISNCSDAIKNLWNIISPCISAYLIRKSYINCNNDRFHFFMKDLEETKTIQDFNENKFINLRCIDFSSTSYIYLYYYIKEEKLFAIKKPKDSSKLQEREISNYENIYYPLMPKYYGLIIKNDTHTSQNVTGIAIEYINGKTLKNIKELKLNEKQKIKIILEILYSIQYLHKKKYIYRDLKPNNVIIDSNYHAILIDFDKLIQKNDDDLDINCSFDLNSIFSAPESTNGNCVITNKCDIYSCGLMIFYILMEQLKDESNLIEFQKKYGKIYGFFLKCTNDIPEKRPSISELIDFFLDFYSKNIKKENDPSTD